VYSEGQKEGRCPSEEVIGGAKQSEGRARGGGGRRGRQRLLVLRLLLAQEGAAYRANTLW
jgi:hypothetical protein